jgi:dephospho-CoA kinase
MGNTRAPLRIIVSGGIGSGKSTVMELLQARGVLVIEADRVGHEVLQPGGSAYAEVAAQWPQALLDGEVDRARLAAIVFTDDEQLRYLEAITHPHIKREIEERVSRHENRDIAVELPLATDFLGRGWTRLVVIAPARIRIERAVARGMDEGDAVNRLEAQPDTSQWAQDADHVIENRGSLAELAREVDRVWHRMHEPTSP